jgi:hypothetical protein
MVVFPWLSRRQFNRRTARRAMFARPPAQPLDLVKPPLYEQQEQWMTRARAQVEQMINALKPKALDAGSREVLNNLINAWAEQALAELDAARDDRRAIARMLIGMADQEVARRKPRFDADIARVSHARAALADAFEALTGRKATEHVPVAPSRTGDDPLQSTVGAIDLRLDGPISEPSSDGGCPRCTARTSSPGLDDATDHPDRGAHSHGRRDEHPDGKRDEHPHG